MISEKKIDLLVERLVNRTNKANEYILRKMGKSISEIKKLRFTDAQNLVNILKYGGSYEDILSKLSQYTDLDIQDIEEIFEIFAKEDQSFYKQFYQYRDVPYIPYKDNPVLKNQSQALANVASNEMYNYTRSNVLGYNVTDLNGNKRFMGLRETYNTLLDNALLNVSQGTTTFDESMSHILSEIGGSGLRTLQYQSGRAIRLDSAINMHLRSRLGELHNENQKIFGREFDFDGWEITVHGNPAPDHADVQGRQFSIDQFDKLQETGLAKDYKGKEVNITSVSKKGHVSHRPISEMNCYHRAFPIILGVSEPEYSEEQLEDIKNNANEKFIFEGKEYSMYEATQLQRTLERKIREQKDIQILAKEATNDKLTYSTQVKIRELTSKYRDLAQASGLPLKMDRMKVSGYKRTKVNNIKENISYKDYFEDYHKNYNKLTDDERYKIVVDVNHEFERKYQPIYEKMDDETKNAFSKYSQQYYKDINKKLLGLNIDDSDNYVGLKGINNIGEYKKEIDKWVEKMDKTIDNSPINENLVLWKGTLLEHYNKYKEGDIFTMDIFNSTSLNRGTAETFTWGKQDAVILKINCPKETKGIYINYEVSFGGESEMLLGRKQKYKYIRTYEDFGKSVENRNKNKKVKIIELEAIK